jgi:hypothetical protein
VEVNAGGKPHIQPLRDKPLREGYGEPHNLFNAELTNGNKFTVFFDYDCTNCYVSESLAKTLPTYRTQKPTTITGVGGTGPQINHNAIITGRFQTTQGMNKSFAVFCGIVPDGTFPGDVTLGKGIFHKWGLTCDGNTYNHEKETVTLNRFDGRPVLEPKDRVSKTYFTTKDDFFRTRAFVAAETEDDVETHTVYPIQNTALKWGDGTPTDARIIAYLAGYVKQFPGLFDPAKRRTDVLMKTTHKIDTGNAEPVKLPPRRYSPFQLTAIRAFVGSHLGDLIVRNKGPWASPMLLTPKKPPGSHVKPVVNEHTIWRICVDYRKVNRRTKKNGHPLPNAMDQIQKAAGHRFYCFLDLKDGFWHITINPKDREKTAFVTPFGIYEWTRMPFGLCNAPATFQALMNEIIGDLNFVVGLLNDIAIWGDTLEELD